MNVLTKLFNSKAMVQKSAIKRLMIFFFAASLNSFPVQAFYNLNYSGNDLKSIRIVIKGKLTNERVEAVLTKDELCTKIRNQRMIELAFEDYRSWDVRCRMIGDNIPNGNIVQNPGWN
jgi:hypothetical protein